MLSFLKKKETKRDGIRETGSLTQTQKIQQKDSFEQDLIKIGFNNKDAEYVRCLYKSRQDLSMYKFEDVSLYRRLIYRDKEVQELFDKYNIDNEHSLFK